MNWSPTLAAFLGGFAGTFLAGVAVIYAHLKNLTRSAENAWQWPATALDQETLDALSPEARAAYDRRRQT